MNGGREERKKDGENEKLRREGRKKRGRKREEMEGR